MKIELSNVISILALLVSISHIVYEIWYRKRKEREDRIPKIKIVKVQFMKDEHIRYSDENNKRNLSYGDNKKSLLLNDDFIYELRNKKQKVYFTDLNGQRSLMLNFLVDDSSIIVEHNITRVTFYNDCKTMLKSIGIISVNIKYTQGSEVTLRGNGEPVSFSVLGGNNFQIYLDEATNDFRNSICELNSNIYNTMKSEEDVLERRFDKYFLKYESITFDVIVCNSDNEVFNLKILLKKNDMYLEPSTEPYD